MNDVKILTYHKILTKSRITLVLRCVLTIQRDVILKFSLINSKFQTSGISQYPDTFRQNVLTNFFYYISDTFPQNSHLLFKITHITPLNSDLLQYSDLLSKFGSYLKIQNSYLSIASCLKVLNYYLDPLTLILTLLCQDYANNLSLLVLSSKRLFSRKPNYLLICVIYELLLITHNTYHSC